MTPGSVHPSTQPGAGIGRDDDRRMAELEDVYLDNTVVLIGPGSATRDPTDDVDLHHAVVEPGEQVRRHGPEGPAWYAKDIYTDPAFTARREFAEAVTRWTGDRTTGWAILSGEHGVLEPWQRVTGDDTRIDDIGGDPTNPAHRVANNWVRRRPDGREIVTEQDAWTAKVAYCLMRWLSRYRDAAAGSDFDVDTLLILADETVLEPLRKRGVFEYGIDRMSGNPNQIFTGMPLQAVSLFETLTDSDDSAAQQAWLSDALDRIDTRSYDDTEQPEMGQYTGNERACCQCDVSAADSNLHAVDGSVYCPDCHPKPCGRCGGWTHDSALGGYPLCPDCQTEHGGQIRDPVNPETTEQTELLSSSSETDG